MILLVCLSVLVLVDLNSMDNQVLILLKSYKFHKPLEEVVVDMYTVK